jgi:hypothetical protein
MLGALMNGPLRPLHHLADGEVVPLPRYARAEKIKF